MFGAGEHGIFVQPVPLEPAHGGGAEFGNEVGRFAETLVAAAPADVSRDGDARREGPLNAGALDFLGGDAFGFFNEGRVVRGAEADVMWENHRAENVVVAVNGIDAVEERNFQARLQRHRAEFSHGFQPRLGAIIGGIGTAAAQHRSEEIFLNIRLILQRGHIDLHHLADFFVESHFGEHRVGIGRGAGS